MFIQNIFIWNWLYENILYTKLTNSQYIHTYTCTVIHIHSYTLYRYIHTVNIIGCVLTASVVVHCDVHYVNSIIDKFGRSFETMTDTYDPTTCVITREKSKLKVNHLITNNVT